MGGLDPGAEKGDEVYTALTTYTVVSKSLITIFSSIGSAFGHFGGNSGGDLRDLLVIITLEVVWSLGKSQGSTV